MSVCGGTEEEQDAKTTQGQDGREGRMICMLVTEKGKIFQSFKGDGSRDESKGEKTQCLVSELHIDGRKLLELLMPDSAPKED